MLNQNYFYAHEADLFTFYRMPKELFTNEHYKKLSAEAKILYGLLLDRNALSIRNNWFDAEGRIFIFFSRDEAMEMLNVGHDTIPKLFKKLKEVDLIEEKRQGLGKANIIYVKKFVRNDGKPSQYLPNKYSHERLENQQTPENRSSGLPKIGVLDSRKSELNKNELNLTYLNETYNNNRLEEIGNKKENDGNNNIVVVADLRSRIEFSLGAKITQKAVSDLINTSGVETIEKYLSNWDKFKSTTKSNVTGFFIKAVKDGYEIPVSEKGENKEPDRNRKLPAFANFTQRDNLDDEDCEIYYKKLPVGYVCMAIKEV